MASASDGDFAVAALDPGRSTAELVVGRPVLTGSFVVLPADGCETFGAPVDVASLVAVVVFFQGFVRHGLSPPAGEDGELGLPTLAAVRATVVSDDAENGANVVDGRIASRLGEEGCSGERMSTQPGSVVSRSSDTSSSLSSEPAVLPDSVVVLAVVLCLRVLPG